MIYFSVAAGMFLACTLLFPYFLGKGGGGGGGLCSIGKREKIVTSFHNACSNGYECRGCGSPIDHKGPWSASQCARMFF